MGKSVILVDCDLRLPSIDQLIKPRKEKPGLLSVLEGRVSFQDAVYEEPRSGLHALMVGPGERRPQLNAADILSSHRFASLLGMLSERYDLVVIDAPPSLIVTDARVMSPLVDTIVYVVRWNRTPRSAVREGLKELRAIGAPVAGIALTLVDEAKAKTVSRNGYSYHRADYMGYYKN